MQYGLALSKFSVLVICLMGVVGHQRQDIKRLFSYLRGKYLNVSLSSNNIV